MYALFENLESGATVKEFLEWYPDVEEWQVRAVLDHEVEYLKTPFCAVKILFDHGTPAALRRHLREHTVSRSAERGWERMENGELIRNAEAEGVRGDRDHGPEYAAPAEPGRTRAGDRRC